MNYLIGEELTSKALKRYFNTWKFKHPDAKDWIRVFEKTSGLELNWYLEYWVNTTHYIDYGIKAVEEVENQTVVTVERRGKMPMPSEITVYYKDGTKELFYAPLVIMRGEKQFRPDQKVTVLPDWQWTNKEYQFTIPKPTSAIEQIIVDESGWMADINQENDYWEN